MSNNVYIYFDAEFSNFAPLGVIWTSSNLIWVGALEGK